MPVWNVVRRSCYQDSLMLMRVSYELESVPGIQRAAAMMGTPQNRALLADAGLLTSEGEAASPHDLILAVIADDPATVQAAYTAADTALTPQRPASTSGMPLLPYRPRTLASALNRLPGTNLALISVPGQYAAAEAWKALRAGLHVMLFSDHVPVEAEIELKRFALAHGLWLMGPDCGTAIIEGAPLGFANDVPRGRIGIAAASGTGLQEVACLIAAAGEGVSQAIGVGGRDLSEEVGGLMMDQALTALAIDPGTVVICVIGKPPGPSVAQHLQARVAQLDKPCVVYYMGIAPIPPGTWYAATTLEDAAGAAVALARGMPPMPTEFTAPPDEIAQLVEEVTRPMQPSQRFVRGIYSGGTLAYEAIALLHTRLAAVELDVTGSGGGHRVIDLGEDRFTVGRPHPMLDGRARREWILREGRDPATAVLLLDVFLGYGAHPDPAGEILPAIRAVQQEAVATGRHLAIVASVCGTDQDPQGRSAQVAALRSQGVLVMPSNAQASRLAALIAVRLAGGRA